MFKGWIEILGILGVIGSLIFVALEIRQNTNAVRGATIQGFSEQSTQFSLALAQDQVLRSAYTMRDSPDVTADQWSILAAYYTGLMRIMENRVRQANIGVISMEDLDSFGSRAITYRTPYFRTFWENRKDQFSPELQQYVESEILSLPMLTRPEDRPR